MVTLYFCVIEIFFVIEYECCIILIFFFFDYYNNIMTEEIKETVVEGGNYLHISHHYIIILCIWLILMTYFTTNAHSRHVHFLRIALATMFSVMGLAGI
jgi:hypothetical protein